MARRRAGGRSVLNAFVEAAFRIAGTIVLESFAFVVWSIGTRSPLGMLRDVRAALGDGRKIAIGCARALIGLIFLCAAVVLLIPALVDPLVDFLPAALVTLLVALVIEHLIGNDIRALTGSRE